MNNFQLSVALSTAIGEYANDAERAGQVSQKFGAASNEAAAAYAERRRSRETVLDLLRILTTKADA